MRCRSRLQCLLAAPAPPPPLLRCAATAIASQAKAAPPAPFSGRAVSDRDDAAERDAASHIRAPARHIAGSGTGRVRAVAAGGGGTEPVAQRMQVSHPASQPASQAGSQAASMLRHVLGWSGTSCCHYQQPLILQQFISSCELPAAAPWLAHHLHISLPAAFPTLACPPFHPPTSNPACCLTAGRLSSPPPWKRMPGW